MCDLTRLTDGRMVLPGLQLQPAFVSSHKQALISVLENKQMQCFIVVLKRKACIQQATEWLLGNFINLKREGKSDVLKDRIM